MNLAISTQPLNLVRVRDYNENPPELLYPEQEVVTLKDYLLRCTATKAETKHLIKGLEFQLFK
jgi:hypothetical protein